MPSRHPISHWLKSHLPFNRQTYLRDISVMVPLVRRPRSPIVQFYSSYRNIGNFIPVQGIQNMLGVGTDVWDMHQQPIDWDFINANYRSAVIGGAGLLHFCFEEFWREFAQHCKLPFVIWGIGTCLPENEAEQGADVAVVQEVFARAKLANVRDRLTLEHYRLPASVDVSVCPSVCYIHDLIHAYPERYVGRQPNVDVLHSIHTTLTESSGNEQVNAAIKQMGLSLLCTDNLQRYRHGIEDILRLYPQARAVVTTRLHGAIIAFAFDLPCLAFSYDPKVRAFVDLYGGGVLCSSIDELQAGLRQLPRPVGSVVAVARAREFGARARAIL